MDSGNIALMRRGVEAFNARDVDAMLVLFAPDCELRSVFAELGGIFHGHAGVRRWHDENEQEWETARLEPSMFYAHADTVLALYTLSGRGRRGGVEISTPLAHVVRIGEDGLIASLASYRDHEEAFRAFGAAESDAERAEP